MAFKAIKSGTYRKLAYDFLLVVSVCIVTFAVSRTVYGKFNVKKFNDLEISPRLLTVVSPESYRGISYWQFLFL